MAKISTKTRIASAALAALMTVASIGAAAAENRKVKIINETGYDLTEFYASHIGKDNWEENIFGNKYLPDGNSVVVNIDDGSGYCLYDFRGVFSDGEKAEKRRVNVCEIETFRFH